MSELADSLKEQHNYHKERLYQENHEQKRLIEEARSQGYWVLTVEEEAEDSEGAILGAAVAMFAKLKTEDEAIARQDHALDSNIYHLSKILEPTGKLVETQNDQNQRQPKYGDAVLGGKGYLPSQATPDSIIVKEPYTGSDLIIFLDAIALINLHYADTYKSNYKEIGLLISLKSGEKYAFFGNQVAKLREFFTPQGRSLDLRVEEPQSVEESQTSEGVGSGGSILVLPAFTTDDDIPF